MSMEAKRFAKNDSGFVCSHCGREVEPLGYSSRNHCPYCLWSLHLDETPVTALRNAAVRWSRFPQSPIRRRAMSSPHRCTKCGAVRRCRAALGDSKTSAVTDDVELIIKLTVHEF